MRGLTRLAASPSSSSSIATAAAKNSVLCSSSNAYSTFGGGGGGRGRGRGLVPPLPPSRSPGAPDRDEDDDSFSIPGAGHGRGNPVLPSSSWASSLIPPSSSTGRGRGAGASHQPSAPRPSDDPSLSRKPVFFRRGDDSTDHTADPEKISAATASPLPLSLSPIMSGSGRGKPPKSSTSGDFSAAPQAPEENRHLRARPSPSQQPKMGREEAVKRAVEVLSRGGPAGRGGRGRGGRGMAGGRGGRGGRGRGGRFRDVDEEYSLHLGDNADGERLQKRLGDETMSKLAEGFEDLSYRVLPSLAEEAYLDALHTNNMIEYEPEYLVQLDGNPDIDEKPPMPLRDYLEKMKPFLMSYEGIQSQEEWEKIIEDTMARVPYLKELMDEYCGPDRVTAKQQQQELERVAKTLPENVPNSVKKFTDRALLSLQSNPGWGFDKKCQFMDKLVWEVSQQYKP